MKPCLVLRTTSLRTTSLNPRKNLPPSPLMGKFPTTTAISRRGRGRGEEEGEDAQGGAGRREGAARAPGRGRGGSKMWF